MKPSLFIIFFIPLMIAPITSQARISTNTETCDSGMAGVQCRKIVTEYRDDGNDKWLKAGVAFQFRSSNGRSCNVNGKLTNAQNMLMIYKTSNFKKSGEWSKPGLVIEQIKEGAWSHSTTWKIDCEEENI